jgi:hypothetical protein
MKDYQIQLEIYLNHPENRKQAEQYLEKYWLDKKELLEFWITIKNKVYNPNFKIIPTPVFVSHFDYIVLKGGLIFTRYDFEWLKSCMNIIGDKQFIVLEDYDETKPPHSAGPPLRFKYPRNITWEEITSGADISEQAFHWPARNYFVFGDSGQWGKYVGNDYKYPLDIIGFDNKHTNLFRNTFKISNEDKIELTEWLSYYGITSDKLI